ncbi:PhoH family protein [uncultured Sphaerochaeta sp.]|uniref:PhoH family protein n=1 Tax=uncultured Sphaerochaeta sp. TaxID=886478 RepID=UPI002A0A38F1|nr:PhoH family protein [uncultured Sphaerochaeta sp.]
MGRNIEFDDEEQMCRVCGINDRFVPYMEMLLGEDLYVKGTCLSYLGTDETKGILFSSLLLRLKKIANKHITISEAEIFMEFQSLKNIPSAYEASTVKEYEEKSFICVQNKIAYPKGPRQEQYIKAMENNQIVFGIGPAGTGKTYLAVTYALSLLLSGKCQKLILTRPIVEAGENLGFLPGDLAQKINPYLRPLYDAMETMVPIAHIRRLEENGSIEIAPLAYMRGRSIQNAVLVLDEAQNTTKEQMKMFLTRLGENASAIITGDISQVDLPRNKDSGLIHAMNLLKGIDGLEIVTFNSCDIVRSRIIQKIIEAYISEQDQVVARGNHQ